MKIALLGYGTVGRGVDQIISERVSEVEVTRILELPDRLTDARMTSDYDGIVDDSSVELVVECMGGLEPAHAFIMRALAAHKHVVTSNKAVVAAHLAEFTSAAAQAGVSLYVEAAVGGGIPWIASIEKVRRIDEVTSFSGIMNGTTNYIVDAMRRQGAEFADVLARAQELGYAERDPSADIDGIDVKNKTIISAAVAFGVDCTP
jgi:homoserine dehydrogenase